MPLACSCYVTANFDMHHALFTAENTEIMAHRIKKLRSGGSKVYSALSTSLDFVERACDNMDKHFVFLITDGEAKDKTVDMQYAKAFVRDPPKRMALYLASFCCNTFGGLPINLALIFSVIFSPFLFQLSGGALQ